MNWSDNNAIKSLALLACLAGMPLCAQESVKTLAGAAQTTGVEDGPGAQARFSDPVGIAVTADGTIFVADSQNHTIRKITPSGTVSTLVGKAGEAGKADGQGTGARFDSPSGIVAAANGSLYVTDTGNHTVRWIDASGNVATIAGSAGIADWADGMGSTARFNAPLGLTAAADGTLYVADSGNHVIRVIAPDRSVTTLAGEAEIWGASDGNGTAGHFNNPVGIARDASGNLFVSDANNYTIRKITPAGLVATIAGKAGVDGYQDGVGADARFGKPAELAIDQRGNLYVTDSLNHTVRKIAPEGVVSTVAGAVRDAGESDGANGLARFFNPYGLAVSPRGDLWIADTYNQTVRRLLAPFTLAAQPNGGQTVVAWEAVIGETYQVQYKDGLGEAAWKNLGGSVNAAELTPSTVDSGAPANGRRFYRVKRLAD